MHSIHLAWFMFSKNNHAKWVYMSPHCSSQGTDNYTQIFPFWIQFQFVSPAICEICCIPSSYRLLFSFSVIYFQLYFSIFSILSVILFSYTSVNTEELTVRLSPLIANENKVLGTWIKSKGVRPRVKDLLR